MDLNKALTLLGLEEGATFQEIKKSYKELIQIWHPDKYSQNNKLYIRAEKETKKINEAYEYLTKISMAHKDESDLNKNNNSKEESGYQSKKSVKSKEYNKQEKKTKESYDFTKIFTLIFFLYLLYCFLDGCSYYLSEKRSMNKYEELSYKEVLQKNRLDNISYLKSLTTEKLQEKYENADPSKCRKNRYNKYPIICRKTLENERKLIKQVLDNR